MAASPFSLLSKWYESNCNDDWEHGYGVKIETLDNPGWVVEIDLFGPPLAETSFTRFSESCTEEGFPIGSVWIDCKREKTRWIGACDPKQIERVVLIFIDWASSAKVARS